MAAAKTGAAGGVGMNVALYLRTSTNDQHPENQMPALERYCYDRGHTIKGVYVEKETAWRQGHQAELARLLDDVRSGRRKYDLVLCWALDRLTRGGAAAILNLVNSFHTYGVNIISIQEPWTELPGELGEVLYSIAGWVARIDSKRRSERTLAGLERVKREGKRLGRPAGAKDKNGRRRKSGYHLRWAGKQTSADNQAQEPVLAEANK